MNWLILLAAGGFEIVWAVALKHSEGFTRPLSSAITLSAMIVSVGLLGAALKGLPLGTAYAVWVGIGTVGTALFGILVLGEPAGLLRLASIALIVAGVVGLKLTAP
jgi:quaternary ammonium compound-resistance protein SugE